MHKRFNAVLFILASSAILSAVMFWLFSRLSMMPLAASEEAHVVDGAFSMMLNITIPIYALVASTLIYILIHFRAEPGREEQGAAFRASPGRVLETVWITVSILLTVGLAAFGSKEFLHIKNDRHADLDIEVRSSQWSWEFYYPDRDLTTSALILPRSKRARILLSSQDVVHSFWVPEFRLKQDALPGRTIPLVITPTRSGDYELVCAELCGMDHTIMRAKVTVVEPDEFEEKMKGESW